MAITWLFIKYIYHSNRNLLLELLYLSVEVLHDCVHLFEFLAFSGIVTYFAWFLVDFASTNLWANEILANHWLLHYRFMLSRFTKSHWIRFDLTRRLKLRWLLPTTNLFLFLPVYPYIISFVSETLS